MLSASVIESDTVATLNVNTFANEPPKTVSAIVIVSLAA